MPDPLTGNGVTSGLRHAARAVEAIRAAGASDAIGRGRRRLYTRYVKRLGHSFNAHIERTLYSRELRWSLGMRAATITYTVFAFFTNALHTRFDPRGPVGITVFGLLFAAASTWISGGALMAKAARGLRPSR
jgi:hypothetical protein